MIQTYTAGIQEKILETIENAESSIIIMVAWVTNETIINRLIHKKRKKPSIMIEILATNDHTNRTYLLKYKNDFEKIGIKVQLYRKSQLMHHKIILCDENVSITGSYNLSKNANKNKENITIIDSERFCHYFKRIYLSLSDGSYIDPNIKLLQKYPDFSRELLSTYYPFTKTDLRKQRNKILLGECFTHDVGDYDNIQYFPGLIFNSSVEFVKFNSEDFFENDYFSCEFPLPVSRDVIHRWMESESHNHILSSFSGHEDLYHLIGDELESSSNQLKTYFKRQIENCLPPDEVEKKIIKGIDIVIENDLWKNHFGPFISKEIMNQILNSLPALEHEQKFKI